jgi:hypothetical protein
MTPLTNGSTRFIPKLEINAPSLVCIDRLESNIASVAEMGTGPASGECVSCGSAGGAWWEVGWGWVRRGWEWDGDVGQEGEGKESDG